MYLILKRNLIFVGQLAIFGYLKNFIGDSWKVMKRSMVITCGKKEGNLYLTNNANGSIVVAKTCINSNTWYSRLEHKSEK